SEAYAHHWAGTYGKCVDQFLAPSQFVKAILVKSGFNAEKISVLPHFQDLPELAPFPVADAPILYFGRLSREKGVSDLILAMRGLPEIRLQIAGEGPQREELEALAKRLQLGNVEFLGHVDGDKLQTIISFSRITVL